MNFIGCFMFGFTWFSYVMATAIPRGLAIFTVWLAQVGGWRGRVETSKDLRFVENKLFTVRHKLLK